MSSIFESQRGTSAIFKFTNTDYPNRKQYTGLNSNPMSVSIVQPIRSDIHNSARLIAASVPGQGPSILSTLPQGVGFNGTGLFLPLPQPGSIVITTSNSGGLRSVLGNSCSMVPSVGNKSTDDSVRLDPTFNGNPFTTTPTLPVAVGNPGWVFIRPILKQILDFKSTLNHTLPGACEIKSYYDGKDIDIRTRAITEVHNTSNSTALAPLGNNSDIILADGLLDTNAASYNAFLAGSEGVNYVDPTTGSIFSTSISILDDSPELLAVAAELKLKRSQALESIMNAAGIQDNYRKLTYSLLQNELKGQWEESLDSALDIFQQISDNPLVQDINKALDLVNKYLPTALSIYNFLFPPGTAAPTVNIGSATVNLDTITVTVNYQALLDVLNNYLPANLHFVFSSNTLTLDKYVFSVGKPVLFTSDLIDTFRLVNTYLPTDLQLQITLLRGEYQAVFVIGGLTINKDGLLIGAVSLDLASAIRHELLCALPPEISNNLIIDYSAATGLTVNGKTADSQGNITIPVPSGSGGFNLSQFFQSLSELPISFKGDNIVVDTNALIDFGTNKINSILPPELAIKVVSAEGSLSSVSIGPLSVKLEQGGFNIGLLNNGSLRTGIEVLDAIGFLPPSLKAFKEAVITTVLPYDKLLGKDKYVTQRTLDKPKSTETVSDSEGQVDLKTGEYTVSTGTDDELLSDINIDSEFNTSSDLDEFNQSVLDTEQGADREDRLFTINTTGNLVDLPLPYNLSGTKGSLLPLLAIGADILSSLGKSSSTPTALPGVSNTGYSPVNGNYYGGGTTNAKTNFGYNIPVCIPTDNLTPTQSETPVPDSDLAIFTPETSNEVDTTIDLVTLPAYQATVPSLTPEFNLDPLDGKSALISELLKYGMGEELPELLTKLDNFVYRTPTKVSQGVSDFIFNNQSLLETYPPGVVTSPSIVDLLDVVNAVADVPVQQVISSVKVVTGVSTPTIESDTIREKRIRLKLDCSDLTSFYDVLVTIASAPTMEAHEDFVVKYLQLPLLSPMEVVKSPSNMVDWLRQVQPALVPATEYLLMGDIANFLKEIIFAKAGLDLNIYPDKLTLLKYLVHSTYGYAPSGADPIGEFNLYASTV